MTGRPASVSTVRARLARIARGRPAWLIGAIWLIYLLPVAEALRDRHDEPWRAIGGLALAGFVVLYLVMSARALAWRLAGRPVPRSVAWRVLAVMFGLFVLMLPGAGPGSVTVLVYLAAAAVFALDLVSGAAVVVAVLAIIEIAGQVDGAWSGARGAGLSVVLAAAAVAGLRLAMVRGRLLAEAEQANSRLALAEERARLARDVHDILGRSLTLITVKAQLAGRLIEVDASRAGAEVGDIERLAREALGDVRAAIEGRRAQMLFGELDSAREALAAAGIAAEIVTEVDDVPPDRRELFSWAVREAVTNVLRHSDAQRCTVRITRDLVEVIDDGPHAPSVAAMGNGLIGLRERAHLADAHLHVGAAPGGGFRLSVEVPPSGETVAAPAVTA